MRISAIVPAFNAAKTLARAVESLINTGYPDLEIVVVDDGSEDSTPAVADELQARYPDSVLVFRHPKGVNRGVSASRNLGINRSTGDLVCFLDSDDYVFPHRFEFSVPCLVDDETIDGVYEFERVVMEDGSDVNEQWDELFGLSEAVEPERLLEALLKGCPWSPNAILCRRSLFERTGLFHESLHIAEDCHMWFRMAAAGRIVAGDPSNPVCVYRRYAGNSFRPGIERKVDMIRAMADFARWAGRQRLTKAVQETIRREISDYIRLALIVAREAKNPRLAWRIAIGSFLLAPRCCGNLRYASQVASLLRGR